MSLTSYRAAPSRDNVRWASGAGVGIRRLSFPPGLRRSGRPFGLAKPCGFETNHYPKVKKGRRRENPNSGLFLNCEWVLDVWGTHQSNTLMGPACTGFKAWRRPTLPQLKLKYHWRSLVSRPSSGWDRVGHRRYDHQAMGPVRYDGLLRRLLAERQVLEIVQPYYFSVI